MNVPLASPRPATDMEEATKESPACSNSDPVVSKRVSKRVQSQIINSGKRHQRSLRRHSTEYCLLAAVLGCTSSDPAYRALLRASPTKDVSQFSQEGSRPQPLAHKKSADVVSLRSFVEEDSMGVAPLPCLFRFVAKCSEDIAKVVASDPGGALLVASCLLDCKSVTIFVQIIALTPNRY